MAWEAPCLLISATLGLAAAVAEARGGLLRSTHRHAPAPQPTGWLHVNLHAPPRRPLAHTFPAFQTRKRPPHPTPHHTTPLANPTHFAAHPAQEAKMARQDAQRYRAQLAQQEKELNAALERARELQLANTVLQAQLADTTGSFRQALETAAELLQVRGAGAGGCRGVGWGLGDGGGGGAWWWFGWVGGWWGDGGGDRLCCS